MRAPIAAGQYDAAVLPHHPAFVQPDQTLPTPAVEPPPGGTPAPAPYVTPPLAVDAPVPPMAAEPSAPAAPPAPAGAQHDDATFEGAIVIDVGPFTDIAALSSFEQGLARVPGAEDVYVSGFEGNRALIELRLAQPVALVGEMRRALPASFTVTDAAAGRLRLDIIAITPGS